MVHVHLVTFKESFFQTLVGLPLSSHKLAESRIHCQGYLHKPYSHCRKTFGIGAFFELSSCQLHLLPAVSSVVQVSSHSPPTLSVLWSGSTDLDCRLSLVQTEESQALFFPQIPQIYSSLFLKHRSHPTSSLITLVVLFEKKKVLGVVCV